MIDWVTLRGYVGAHEPISDGAIISVSADGELEWQTRRRLAVESPSSETNVFIRSVDSQTVEVSGNLLRWLQGHNIVGIEDVASIVTGWCAAATRRDVPLPTQWGELTLTRVDIAHCYDLGSSEAVIDWLRHAASGGHMRNRGRGSLIAEGTVYWGQRSRRWSLKAYDKEAELKHHKRGEAVAARGLLRVETTYRGLELTRLGLAPLAAWGHNSAKVLYMSAIEKFTLPEGVSHPKELVADVPLHLRGTLLMWAEGIDVRSVMSRATAYRHRRELLAHGVDVFTAANPNWATPPLRTYPHPRDMTPIGLDWARERGLTVWTPSPVN